MESDRAQLSSAVSVLDDLTARIVEVADRYRGGAREDVTAELDEVERTLRQATRRLGRAVDRMRGPG
ncbi:MAG TPA: hypothetical protein VK866_10105 [Acidimicrobiales bacterium]|nr:hypothetical protein [Acidimicrobiales bacterium]